MSEDDPSKKNPDLIELPHHRQLELCRTRLAYRQGRRLTAVKAYSIAGESSHLLVFGVPKVNLRPEIKSLFSKFGKVTSVSLTTNYPTEDFTECFHVVYDTFQSARIAKKRVDNRNFYGGSLHVCFAPEFETVEETKSKLNQRKLYVLKRLMTINRAERINADTNNLNDDPVAGSSSEVTEVSERIEAISDNVDGSVDSSKRKFDDDGKEYVFKHRKRKRKENSLAVNVYKRNIVESTLGVDDEPEFEPTNGRVAICDAVDKPIIRSLPKKTCNKIIMKNNTKLI